MLTQAEEDAGQLLYHLFENDLVDAILSGRQLQGLLELDPKRAGRCILMLQGAGFLKEETTIYGEGPLWALTYYRMTPAGMLGLNHFQNGETPFKTASTHNHTGDVITTTMGDVSASAVAIGRQAQASYASGIDPTVFNAQLKAFRAGLNPLPQEERDDGEHQLAALALAARKGPEAMQGRAASFYRFLQGLWDNAAQVATGVFLYHIAVILFAQGGVTLPALPPGL